MEWYNKQPQHPTLAKLEQKFLREKPKFFGKIWVKPIGRAYSYR